MEQLRLSGPDALVLEPQRVQQPGPGEVVVEVVAAGICGSDLHGYRGVNERRRPGTVMGHEVSGVVRTLGPAVPATWADQPVAVNPVLCCGRCPRCREGRPQLCPAKALIGCVPEHPGGFATTLLAPAAALVPWAGPAPLTWGPFAEPLAVGIEAADRTPLEGREVLVLGSGPVAVAGAWAAQRRGATVTVTETHRRRRRLLRSLGLTTLPFGEEPRRTPDAVLDCVAVDDSLDYALRHVAPGGDVAVVGLGAPVAALPVERLVQGPTACWAAPSTRPPRSGTRPPGRPPAGSTSPRRSALPAAARGPRALRAGRRRSRRPAAHAARPVLRPPVPPPLVLEGALGPCCGMPSDHDRG